MRRIAFALAALFATFGQVAQADITADYWVWGPIGPAMRIEVADNGDARVQMRDGATVAVRRDGVLYLVREDRDGPFVIRFEDFARIEAELDQAPDLAGLAGAQLVERGTETVGGRTGTVLDPVAPGEPPGDPRFAFVVSTDPDLAPVGEMLAHVFGTRAIGMEGGDLIDEIHARGTLIRMAFLLRLERTSAAPIPASAFVLPGPVVSGEEARARLGPAW